MADSKFLDKMLERLYAALANGPCLNCRPQRSRQRIDLLDFAKLVGPQASEILGKLLSPERTVKFTAPLANLAVPEKTKRESSPGLPAAESEAGELNGQKKAAQEQAAVLRRLGIIAEDAQEYENETGAQVLYVGYPLLLVPGDGTRGKFGVNRRILSPIAFIPARLKVKKGRAPGVELEACGDGIDLVIPNTALLAWVERQSGQKLRDLFGDEEGTAPWRELNDLVATVCQRMEMEAPAALDAGMTLEAAPPTDEGSSKKPRIVNAAVLGLFPLSNQSIIRDMEALAEGEPALGPVESFLKVAATFAEAPPAPPPETGKSAPREPRTCGDERLVTEADPCQARAVRLARHSRGLVIHGPPGTGKSQTIANIIGDHLARRERVLLVCDKRTALDVVKYRLDALGLGNLCAVVHDPQRDQRDLYLGIRDQLEGLPEARTTPSAAPELARIDRELAEIHTQLAEHDRALSERPSPAEPSFHELVGEWLSAEVRPELATATASAKELPVRSVLDREREVTEVLERGRKEGYPDNPWRRAMGDDLVTWMSRPMDDIRQTLGALVQSAQAADAVAAAEVLPFAATPDVVTQGKARVELGKQIEAMLADGHRDELVRWAAAPPEKVTAAREEIAQLTPHLETLRQGPLDPELAAAARAAPVPLPEMLPMLARLDTYLKVARKWYAFLFFWRRLRVASVLLRFGLAFSVLAVERVARFLNGLRARVLLEDFERRLLPGTDVPATDESLRRVTSGQIGAWAILAKLATDPSLVPISTDVCRLLQSPAEHARLLTGLRCSLARAEGIAALEARVQAAGFFSGVWQQGLQERLRRGETCAGDFEALHARQASAEGILRIEGALAGMPPALADAMKGALSLSATPEEGSLAIRRAALGGEIARRIKSAPVLRAMDAQRLSALHERFGALEEQKRGRVREAILHVWTEVQQQRLLASTRTRLNNLGADLRRRLFVRGNRVMKVRQVIAAGLAAEGGDPLFDLRPVWMVSPETVAQIFPRQPLFDVVIFDESSQCRIEEAIPVLTRARRVVIAGDPKQLPPTRFFETAVAQSESIEVEGEQELFEQRQAEVEDLLAAALNLAIDQCYLDVHYRSQNGDLIEFSNQNFYDSRLQAIPGHPSNRARLPPVRLLHAGGTYEKRANLREAEEVVQVVRELLARPRPPSVGIACFNLTQREAILDALDDAAGQDAAFADRLAEARSLRRSGAFEGLFVKNLENVQGDERDHMIISTTYGPDAKGKFYRRFGPLGMAGGGRRLNVLVTRARQQVHLVTSIPREIYRALPPVESGKIPAGSWLLYAYVKFAEDLGAWYQEKARAALLPAPASMDVRVRDTELASKLAEAFARSLAKGHGMASDVHWGNDGFCVDIALRHPSSPEDVTLGILCDRTRYDRAPDRIGWDLFRTRILAKEGWRLMRLWSPLFFRDPATHVQEVLRQMTDALAVAHSCAADGLQVQRLR